VEYTYAEEEEEEEEEVIWFMSSCFVCTVLIERFM
jgi:hypothetical protein